MKVDLQPGTPASPTHAASGQKPSDSPVWQPPQGESVFLPGAAGIVSRSVEPDYPLLAKQMKVEGAVVLNALIGRDGNIQQLQVLSGPRFFLLRHGKRCSDGDSGRTCSPVKRLKLRAALP